MKYKVLIGFEQSTGSENIDGAASFSFYTKSQAVNFITAMTEGVAVKGWLWDGSTLTQY